MRTNQKRLESIRIGHYKAGENGLTISSDIRLDYTRRIRL